jgi:threonine synthase
MTTVTDANVFNIAIRGTFDDGQAIVKAIFNDIDFKKKYSLGAINSINWGRIVAQAVYYVTAAVALGAPARKVSFAVPTGNFGDVFAGYVAKRMGLPIDRLIVATNANDILARTHATGRYELRPMVPTQSPSMDIQVASNFERLLFELGGRHGGRVASLMSDLAKAASYTLTNAEAAALRREFDAGRIDETATADVMTRIHRQTGLIVDPHTAVGIGVATTIARDPRTPVVALATAHPAKFPDAVGKALGDLPVLPERLRAVMSAEERYEIVPNDAATVTKLIEKHSRAARGTA